MKPDEILRSVLCSQKVAKMTYPISPTAAKANCKSGVVMALREIDLWHQREAVFATRKAAAAADYARIQQAWWRLEARRSVGRAPRKQRGGVSQKVA